jgi:hypothetical protein
MLKVVICETKYIYKSCVLIFFLNMVLNLIKLEIFLIFFEMSLQL